MLEDQRLDEAQVPHWSASAHPALSATPQHTSAPSIPASCPPLAWQTGLTIHKHNAGALPYIAWSGRSSD